MGARMMLHGGGSEEDSMGARMMLHGGGSEEDSMGVRMMLHGGGSEEDRMLDVSPQIHFAPTITPPCP